MALVTKDFSINITPGEMPPTVHVSEYDIGRSYNVTLIDENGSAFTIPTETTATVEGTLNGAVGFSTSATISDNRITFSLTESMTAYAGKALCKIKLTQNSQPIQTCAFILAVDRAGVEADTVIGAPGFEEQIVNAVNDWLDEHPPASGGMTEEFKQALLDCFENVAWINDDGQTYYDALEAALYPPKTLVSISAVFNQGSAVIYDTDSLDTLRQYLTVTATYDDTSTGIVTNYTLSGTLTVGTSTITVLYNGKTATFNVVVTEYIYKDVEYVETDGNSRINTGVEFDTENEYEITLEMMQSNVSDFPRNQTQVIGWNSGGGFVYSRDEGNVVASWWHNGVAGTERLAKIGEWTTGVMVIEAGASTNTTITYTNSQGTAAPVRTHEKLESRATSPFPLFASTKADGTIPLVVTGFRIRKAVIKVNGTIVRNMVSCYRTTDGAIGFRDMANDNAFYGNAGSGQFRKGADIE